MLVIMELLTYLLNEVERGGNAAVSRDGCMDVVTLSDGEVAECLHVLQLYRWRSQRRRDDSVTQRCRRIVDWRLSF